MKYWIINFESHILAQTLKLSFQNSKPMKPIILSLAMTIIYLQANSQVVVQQQTTTTTYQQQMPGFQMQFNVWDPFNQGMQSPNMVWDPITNSFIHVQQQQIVNYVDQFGNPIVPQQNSFYVDQFGNPINTQQNVIYVDQFGNPVAPQQNLIYVDQFGNQVQQQQQVQYFDQFGNPIQHMVYTDPFLPAPPAQIFPVQPQPINNSPLNSAFPMNQGAFGQFLGQLSSQSFESTKLTLARQVLGSNWFTSEQVRQMMTQMTFEDSKVEIARLGYNRVLDPQNYFTVNSAFTFSSSVDELNRYLFGQ